MVLRIGTVAAVLGAAALLASCSTDDAQAPPGVLDVVASFSPLAYVVERVGGPYVQVTDLTPAGTEPHDLELSARDVGHVEQADLVVYLKGFSPAVDEAVSSAAGDHGLDTGSVARLTGNDPHFWLDPIRLADVADAVARRLGDLHPDEAATFRTNAAALADDLTALDADFRTGLANCTNRNLVTSHAAFGYLAQRYQLTPIGITGISPEEEPTPADLAHVTSFVKAHDVRTIYTETLVSRAVADTIASETGARVAVLDPIETRTAGDYLQAMRVDLATLREGQGCT